MAITVVKKEVSPKATPKAEAANEITEITARFAKNKLALEAKLAKLADLVKSVKEDEDRLLEHADLLVAPEESTTLSGDGYVVNIGPRGRKVTAMDNAAIKKDLGDELFDKLASFSVEDLKKYMTGVNFEKAVTYVHANKRKVTVKEAKEG